MLGSHTEHLAAWANLNEPPWHFSVRGGKVFTLMGCYSGGKDVDARALHGSMGLCYRALTTLILRLEPLRGVSLTEEHRYSIRQVAPTSPTLRWSKPGREDGRRETEGRVS